MTNFWFYLGVLFSTMFVKCCLQSICQFNGRTWWVLKGMSSCCFPKLFIFFLPSIVNRSIQLNLVRIAKLRIKMLAKIPAACRPAVSGSSSALFASRLGRVSFAHKYNPHYYSSTFSIMDVYKRKVC